MYSVGIPAFVIIALAALVLQSYLPLYLRFVRFFDLPLLVVIYFALLWQNPSVALLAGAAVGMAQDSLSGGFIGMFGTVKTVIGFVTSSLSGNLEAENIGIRLLSVFVACWIQAGLLFFLQSVLQTQPLGFQPRVTLLSALVNTVAAMLFFLVLDRFRKPS